jgi:hypothetical protein
MFVGQMKIAKRTFYELHNEFILPPPHLEIYAAHYYRTYAGPLYMVQEIIIFKILPLQLVPLRKSCISCSNRYNNVSGSFIYTPHFALPACSTKRYINRTYAVPLYVVPKIIIFKILPLYIVPLRKS